MRSLLKRWWFWLGTLLLGCPLFVLVSFGHGRVNLENFDRIQIGMANADVLLILGPSDPIRDGIYIVFDHTDMQCWYKSGGPCIIVWFDEENRVTGKQWASDETRLVYLGKNGKIHAEVVPALGVTYTSLLKASLKTLAALALGSIVLMFPVGLYLLQKVF